RIERDGIGHAVQPTLIALDDAERAGVPTDERVEIHQLSTLPLPAHPDGFGRVPATRAMQVVEWRLVRRRLSSIGGHFAVHDVERSDARDRRVDDRVVARRVLRCRIEMVAEERKANLPVTIREILNLDVLE